MNECGVCKSKIKSLLYCNGCFQRAKSVAERRGRKEELEKVIKEFEGSLEFYECDYCKFEQQVVDKVMEELNEHINKLKKRLKELV